jgi:hypothetical protein
VQQIIDAERLPTFIGFVVMCHVSMYLQ